MFQVEYLCSFRPVWYAAGESASLGAAIADCLRLYAARRRPVRVTDDAGRVRYSLGGSP